MVLPFLPALLTAGATVIGARSQKKAADHSSYLNSAEGYRKEGEKWGFNPLVLAGAGSMGVQFAPQYGSILASGLAAAADQMQVADGHKIQLAELEMRNRELTKQNERMKLSPSVPGIYGPKKHDNNPEDLGDTDHPGSAIRFGKLERGKTPITAVQDAGSNTYINPRVMDAEASEARYGDLAQELAGGYSLVKDNFYNIKLQKVAKHYGRDVADEVHRRFGSPPYQEELDDIIRDVAGKKSLKDRTRQDRNKPPERLFNEPREEKRKPVFEKTPYDRNKRPSKKKERPKDGVFKKSTRTPNKRRGQ